MKIQSSSCAKCINLKSCSVRKSFSAYLIFFLQITYYVNSAEYFLTDVKILFSFIFMAPMKGKRECS